MSIPVMSTATLNYRILFMYACISWTDINECIDPLTNFCSDNCNNEEPLYSCSCPAGKTLASDGLNCGGLLLHLL